MFVRPLLADWRSPAPASRAHNGRKNGSSLGIGPSSSNQRRGREKFHCSDGSTRSLSTPVSTHICSTDYCDPHPSKSTTVSIAPSLAGSLMIPHKLRRLQLFGIIAGRGMRGGRLKKTHQVPSAVALTGPLQQRYTTSKRCHSSRWIACHASATSVPRLSPSLHGCCDE